MEIGKKTFWLSIANISACLGVIILHCNGVFWSFPQGRLWYTANFLETFFYWPVPIFFMITGVTLINYRERYTTREFFYKRFYRVIVPFLFWSVISLICYWFKVPMYDFSINNIITDIINTKYMRVYWFFIPLFAIYLSIPLLSAVRDNLKIEVFTYIGIITFFLASLLPTLAKLTNIHYNIGISPSVSAGYLLYVFLGYIISKKEISRNKRYIFYLVSLVGWYIDKVHIIV